MDLMLCCDIFSSYWNWFSASSLSEAIDMLTQGNMLLLILCLFNINFSNMWTEQPILSFWVLKFILNCFIIGFSFRINFKKQQVDRSE